MRKLINTNKKATFEYFIIETFEAGIQLVGTEGNGRGFAGAQRQGRAGRIQIVSGTI